VTLEQLLDKFRADQQFGRNVTEWREIEEQPARYAKLPQEIDQRLVDALKKKGVHNLYIHQRKAYDTVGGGRNVVVVTPTASGKTLCYNLPVLQTVLTDKKARAMYLFPTKALSHDQLNELHLLISYVNEDIRTYTFDGDTPTSARKAIRKAGHIVLTNPDMLHTGILPHHTLWIKLFENLRFVVIDEIHHYRGIFGSHVANVIRRLKRICSFYGAKPQFIMCSATIANPQELAEKIAGEKVTLIDDNGAPAGKKHFILFNPPVVNRELGIRKNVVQQASELAREFLVGDIQALVFARSRLRVEVLLTTLQERMRKLGKPDRLVRGYRGGYLPLERREIEKGLRDGTIMTVVSTNALELGIDIGSLDACILAGYPGTIASTWQQAGRSGRRSDVSAAILVASSAPIDQYMINHPAYFFEQSPEHGIIDPNNQFVLMSHVKCAAFELPFEDGEVYGLDATSTRHILSYLEEHGVLRHAGKRWHWMAETYPAEGVSLRTACPENVVIIDTSPKAEVIGEVDYFSAPAIVHEGAIYLHGGRQFTIERLDLDDKKAYAREVDVDYYTDAEVKVAIRVLNVERQTPLPDGQKAEGEVSVTWQPTMYKKIKFGTYENVGDGRIHLPETTMHTRSYWVEFSEGAVAELKQDNIDVAGSLQALANVLVNVAPVLIMCDPSDIRAQPRVADPFTQRPAVYLYECYPGGVGYSAKMFAGHDLLCDAARDLIKGCSCRAGCPSCVGPALEVSETGKAGALKLLDTIGGAR
jgi:DEAD/DEAH box helicase domain-containing protein